jgi:hypothetical protein
MDYSNYHCDSLLFGSRDKLVGFSPRKTRHAGWQGWESRQANIVKVRSRAVARETSLKHTPDGHILITIRCRTQLLTLSYSVRPHRYVYVPNERKHHSKTSPTCPSFITRSPESKNPSRSAKTSIRTLARPIE